jgi:hypothetical protein
VSDEAWAYKAIIEDIRKRSDADYSSLKQTTDILLSEKDAEIERLENRVSDLTRDCIYGHKALLTRAADALKRSHLNGGTILLNSDCEVCKLIQELTETLQ